MFARFAYLGKSARSAVPLALFAFCVGVGVFRPAGGEEAAPEAGALEHGHHMTDDHNEHGDHGGHGSHGGHDGGHGGHQTGGKIKEGHYFGYLKMDGREEKIATEADVYIFATENHKVFPRLTVLLKFSLGGYHTSEYFSQIYQDVRTDFVSGDFLLDEPGNELAVSAKVHNMGSRVHIAGRAWSRSSALGGELSLTLQTDEPDDDEPSAHAPGGRMAAAFVGRDGGETPFAPPLEGQYNGKCDGQTATFIIQTMRGLKPRDAADGKDLFEYQISGMLAYRRNGADAGDPRPWSTRGYFGGGLYNPFRGRLVFLGPSTTAIECEIIRGRLKCAYKIPKSMIACTFDRARVDTRPPARFSRKFQLTPSAEQLKELPPFEEEQTPKLAEILAGQYRGYLHHETSDHYQSLALQVVTSATSDNPHNSNRLFVSASSTLYFSRYPSAHFITQRYEPRSFYIRPGFALSAPGTDSFILIEEWKTGYIRGIWYSQTFGRVGEVELIKNPNSFNLPAALAAIPSWEGEFAGRTRAVDPPTEGWFQIVFTNPLAERLDSTVPFMGSYQTTVGISKFEPIDRGRYDPYTGAIGWSFSDNGGNALVTGKVADDGSLMMYWPPVPNTFDAWMANFIPVQYRRLGAPDRVTNQDKRKKGDN